MTFFHFCNCLVLAYAPYFIVYKYSALSEYSNIWRCAQGGLVYLLTQFLKMLTLATFFPVLDSADFDPIYETMKSAVDIMDVLGLHFVITYILTGKGEVKLLTAGLGWAAAHSLLSYFVVLFVGARTTGFSWHYIQTAFESNNDLIFYLSLAALVWTYNRQDQPPLHLTLTSGLLLFCIIHSFIFQLLYFKFLLRSWELLGVKFLLNFGLAALTLVAYSAVGKQQQQHQAID